MRFHNLYEDTVHICPPDAECAVMYKGSMKTLFKESLHVPVYTD